jgi:hypothetical protein
VPTTVGVRHNRPAIVRTVKYVVAVQSGQALLNAASMLLGASSVEETRWQSRRLRRVVELLRQSSHDPRLAGK